MSKCISSLGEYSEHTMDASGYTCTSCGVDDVDGMRARIAELETESRNVRDGLKSFMRVLDVACEFINERPEYVTACRNAHPDNTADYHRWQGGAEARRQLAQRLGWTVPHEIGEKTTPIEEAER